MVMDIGRVGQASRALHASSRTTEEMGSELGEGTNHDPIGGDLEVTNFLETLGLVGLADIEYHGSPH
jgi:hypothetical protein